MPVQARGRATLVSAAIAVLVLSLTWVVGGATPAAAIPNFSISGTVTLPAGAPADYYGAVSVHASQTDGASSGDAWVNTADGTFSIDGLTPGHYTILFDIGDGVNPPPPLLSEYYNNTHVGTDAALVAISTEDVTGINATLEWSGSISGTVTLAAGTPDTSKTGLVAVASSAATGTSPPAAVDPITGAYSIPNLPDGSYTVYFQASAYAGGDTSLKNEVYNDVYDPADGTPVVVSGGAATTGINAELSRTGHFTSAPTPVITHLALNVGSTLGISSGSWAPAPTFAKRWYRNGVPIAGATGPQYELTPDDRGTDITFTLTASKAGYTSVTRTSAALHIPLAFKKTVTPNITGTAKSGHVLTAHRGTWSPATTSNSYQWKRDGGVIDGATHSTYTVTAADRGHDVSVTVTGKRSGYLSTSRTSAPLRIAKAFTKTVTPTITGTAKAGKTLTAHRGTWSPTASYSYRWYRNGTAISGATHSTYKLTSSDKGKKITVKVTGKRTGYTTVTKTSASKTIAK